MHSMALFVAASIALIITPGPDVIYVLTRGMAQGRAAGAVSALGVTTGIFVHMIVASLGLALLLRTSILAYGCLKVAGGIYLIYLGVKMVRTRTALIPAHASGEMGLWRCFRQGLISNVLNPKVALFFVSFLPQFLAPNDTHRDFHLIEMGLLFAAMTVAFLAILGLCAGFVGNWLARRVSIASSIKAAAGSVLVLLGLRLLLPQKR